MSQHSFDFSPPQTEGAKEIQQWVESHNQQVIKAAHTPNTPPGSLLSALNESDAKANAVYLLRGTLNQILTKSLSTRTPIFKRQFLQALRTEIQIKNTSQNPAFALRNTLMKNHPTR